MDGKDRLLYLWRWLRLPTETIGECSRDYDLLCPHCRVAGRGDVHLQILRDDSGFRCVAMGHEYRWNAPHVRCVPRDTDRRSAPMRVDLGQALGA